MKWFCALSLVVLTGLPAPAAAAGDTVASFFDNVISLYVDDPVEGLVTYGTVTPFTIFEIVVLVKMTDPSAAAEFVMTELPNRVPGVFRIDATKINDTAIDLGDNSLGEYMMAFGNCEAAGEFELLRLRYAEAGDLIHRETLEIRGFEAGDTQPSSYLGRTAYRDCDGEYHYLEPEPSRALLSGACGPPAGSCVLNAGPGAFRCSPTETIAVSTLKARY